MTGKLSYALTNLFGNYNFATNEKSSGSWYFDLSGSFDLGSGQRGAARRLPEGRQDRQRLHTDYSLTLTGTWARALGQRRDRRHRRRQAVLRLPVNGKFLGKTSGFVSVKYVF